MHDKRATCKCKEILDGICIDRLVHSNSIFDYLIPLYLLNDSILLETDIPLFLYCRLNRGAFFINKYLL